MASLRSLASDTVVYGATTILSRLLNWLLMPFYVHVISQADYSVVTLAYAFIALMLVVATLGFETGYFRFATTENKHRLLGSLSDAVLLASAVLFGVFMLFTDIFCKVFSLGDDGLRLLQLSSVIVAADAYNAIFFAELRFERKSMIYAVLRLVQVLITIVFNCIFLLWMRHSEYDLGFSPAAYILLANVIGSLSSTIYFLPRIARVCGKWDSALLSTVFLFSFPLVGMGFLGMANQNIEKILIPILSPDDPDGVALAIYSASYKVGILMAIFTQSFRMAFEPFFFREKSDTDKREVSGTVLKYFVFFGLIIFAAVMFFQKFLLVFDVIPDNYAEGMRILPFILTGQLFYGVYYSLSMWYKAIDKTYFGVIMSATGLAVNTALNFVLIPRIGYLGAAISTLVGYFVMMMMSFLLGQKYYPIKYPFGEIIKMFLVVFVLVELGCNAIDHFEASEVIYWLPIAVVGFVAILAEIAYHERDFVSRLLRRRR